MYTFKEKSINHAIEIILQPINEIGISAWFFLTDIEDKLPKKFKGKLNGNGSAIFQNDRGMGKKYVVEKEYSVEGTRELIAIRLAGFCTSKQNTRSNKVPVKIRNLINKKSCCVCSTKHLIECDHKDGRKDTSDDVNENDSNEYQPLCNHCNKVKREVCKHCSNTEERFDAKKLGFNTSWTIGNIKYQPATLGCNGCYWYDVIQFIRKSCK